MRPFTIPATASTGSAAGWQARFPKRLLVTLLLVGAFLAFLAPTSAKAQAIPVTTQPIQLSELTMIDQQHGWAFNSDYTHVFSTQQGPEHWTDVTPSLMTGPDYTIITGSFFLNATHGYLGILQNNNPFLLSTQDGGLTWQSTPFNITAIGSPPSIYQITFLDAQHGWLAFNRANLQPGIYAVLLMSTSDGGKTWQTLIDTSQNQSSLPHPLGYGLSNHFTFVDPQNGWVTGSSLAGDTYLYATHDGGKTWSQSNIPALKGSSDMYFSQDYGPFWQSKQDGTLFVKYDTISGNGMPHVTAYQTDDGGKTWALGPSSPSTYYTEFITLSFISAQNGSSFGFDSQGQFIIHNTSTGGLSWSIIHPTGLLQANADTQVVSSLSFLNATTGWVIIKDEQYNLHLFQTGNGGKTWHELNPVTK